MCSSVCVCGHNKERQRRPGLTIVVYVSYVEVQTLESERVSVKSREPFRTARDLPNPLMLGWIRNTFFVPAAKCPP